MVIEEYNFSLQMLYANHSNQNKWIGGGDYGIFSFLTIWFKNLLLGSIAVKGHLDSKIPVCQISVFYRPLSADEASI